MGSRSKEHDDAAIFILFSRRLHPAVQVPAHETFVPAHPAAAETTPAAAASLMNSRLSIFPSP